jgi:hypothetical protein
MFTGKSIPPTDISTKALVKDLTIYVSVAFELI